MTVQEAAAWLVAKKFKETGYLSWRLGNILVEIHEKPEAYIDVFYRINSGDLEDIHISAGSVLASINDITALFDQILDKMTNVRDSMSTAEYAIATLS